MIEFYEEVINQYVTRSEKVINLTTEYNKAKSDLEIKKLLYKYGPELENIKTIKEKEEKAILATETDKLNLIQLENELNIAKMERYVAKIELDIELALLGGEKDVQ